MIYLGKELSEYDKEQLEFILKSLTSAEAKRNEASQHEKFNKLDGKGMEFPPPNKAFVELKNAIELEIKERK